MDHRDQDRGTIGVTLLLLCLAVISCASKPAPSTSTRGIDSLATRVEAHHMAGEVAPGLCDARDLDKTCSSPADCVVVDQVIDACGSVVHIGVSMKGRLELAARPKVDLCPDAGCPSCVVRWQFTEDCATSVSPIVECRAGRCMTRAGSDTTY